MAKVLVVDDDSVSQLVLRHVLGRAGHTTVSAFDGREALARLVEIRVDLALVDVSMPEMDGLSLLGLLRADDRWMNLPVVMLTASGEEEDRIAARHLGVDEFLTKPTSSWQLLETLERLLG